MNKVVAEVSPKHLAETARTAEYMGYKKTDFGLIPTDWEAATIGQVTSWLSGGTPNRKIGDYWHGEIPWISGSTLKSLELSTSDQFLTEEGVLAGSKMAPLGSTLLLVRGSALHSEIRAGLVVSPLCFNQDVKALIPNKSLNPRYLTIYLLAMESELLKLVSSAGNSAGVLDTELVKNFKFLKPPSEEQTAIANALSDVDALIQELEKLITKKQAIKTATMQQLLTGRTRLPQFAYHADGSKKGYKQSELGEIPEDWEVVDFGDCLKLVVDNRGKTPPLATNGFPMLEVNAVFKQGRSPNLEKVSKFVSKATFESWFRDGHPIKGDILIVTVGSAGETSYVGTEGYCIAQNLIALRLTNNFDNTFVYYLTTFTSFKKQVEAVIMGAVQPSLKVPHLKKFRFAMPVIQEEQAAIAAIISDMDEEIQAVEQRLGKTRQIKQGMMQELLTGRTRLVKPELV